MNGTCLRTKIRSLLASENLKARAARGGIWLGTGNGIEQLFRFVRNMILARLLAPEAFGVMAIVLAVNTAFESFTEIGIRQAVIQSPRGSERTYLNGAWFFSGGRALFLYAAAFFGAPLIARLYENPDLVPLLRVAFLAIIFSGFISTEAYLSIKRLKFNRWVFAWQGGSICGIVIGIGLAFYFRTVWALVIGFTCEAALRCLLSYVLFPFVPKFDFDRDNIRALIKFSRGMFGLPLLSFIFMRADVFVIGKLCPFSDLGLYAMAAALAAAPFRLVSIASQIMMPAFSEKQHDTVWINKKISDISAIFLYAGIPLLGFIILYGREVLLLVYGAKYGAVAVPFAIIFARQLIYYLGVPIATVYIALGRPELHRLFTAIRTALIVVMIVPAIKLFGLPGAAAAGLISMMVGYMVQINRLRTLTGLHPKIFAKMILLAVCAALVVGSFWLVTHSFAADRPAVSLLFGGAGCLASYAAAAKLFLMQKSTADFPDNGATAVNN
ncbi:MAG: oligosaccharide flippase family protein [Deltaproteobacteria bacterium]|nr:oligosaccharide flippase family protein [Deltaproteobacteria bacterium]